METVMRYLPCSRRHFYA